MKIEKRKNTLSLLINIASSTGTSGTTARKFSTSSWMKFSWFKYFWLNSKFDFQKSFSASFIYLFFLKKKENSRLNQIYKISIVIKPFNFASLWLTFVCVKGFWGQVVFVNSICTLRKKWRVWDRKKENRKNKINFTSFNKLPINQDSSSSINKPIINL